MGKKEKWNIKDVPDLTGRDILITGANSGTGFESSKILADKGAHVIMACRNLEKGQNAVDQIKSEHQNASLELMELDLANLSSIEKFSNEFKNKFKKLDVLINNAGIMMAPNVRTADGFDIQFGTNHLGHFALTAQLMDLLKVTPGSRIITMSSNAHKFRKIHFDDINFKNPKNFGCSKAYSQSKLANLLFAFELDRKLKAEKLTVLSIGAHPGWAATNLQSAGLDMKKGLRKRLMKGVLTLGNKTLAQSAEKGAYPLIMATTSDKVNGGDYIGPSRLAEQRGNPKIVKSSKGAQNEEIASKLWDLSEELTKIKFVF